MFGRREPCVHICRGFHLSGGERVKLHLLRADGTDEWVAVTVSVIMGSQREGVEDAVIEKIVVREGP